MKPESANHMYLIIACCLTLPAFSSQHSLTTDETEIPIINDKHTELTPTIELPISHTRTRDLNVDCRGMESTNKTPTSTTMNERPKNFCEDEKENPVINEETTELTNTTERSTEQIKTTNLNADSRVIESTNNLANSTTVNQRPEKHSKDYCRGVEYQDGFIKTDLDFFFRMNRSDARKCLKDQISSEIERVLRHRNRNNTDQSCLDFTKDESLDLEYLQTSDDVVLWYPFIHCKNESKCNSVWNFFEECESTVAKDVGNSSQNDLGVALMPSLPRKRPSQGNTRNCSAIFAYLHISRNNSLLEDCGELLCESEYSHRSNITILSLEKLTNHNCKQTLRELGSHVCYPKKNAFCFSALRIPSIQRSIVFITDEDKTLNETLKTVIILRSFMNQDKHWCERPLDYTTKSRIIHNVYQTFFYCQGTGRNTTTTDAWIIANLTENDSVVSLHSHINHSIILSNLMLRALISTNTMINTTIYNQFAASNITFKRDTSQFNIHVFEGSHSEAGLLNLIKKEHLSVVTNKYFSKLTDKRSMWSQLNWIIFHNCSSSHKGDKDLFLFLSNETRHKGDKDLFLFSSNETLDFESICNDKTDVLLTTIRREKVALLHKTFFRGCTDAALHENMSEHCKNHIKDGSDYETRFFQFLVHPLPLNKLEKNKIEEIDRELKEENEIFNVNFPFNTNPEILGGISYIKKKNPPSKIPEDDNILQQESQRLTLQILVIASLTNNAECLGQIKNDSFSFEIKKSEHFTQVYEIGPVATGVSNTSCLKILPLSILQDLKTVRLNKFWPICMYDKLIAWNESGKGVPEWDYLSSDCQRKEIALFTVCCSITITTITGNILVIAIIISTKLIKKQAFMIYTSLALSDLLVGVTSALPAVIDTYSLMNGNLTIYDLIKPGPLADFLKLEKTQPRGFQDVRFERKGWDALPGITLNISIMTSLMSLALLGIDRLLMLKMVHLKSSHIKNGIIIIWAWNIICAILISMDTNDLTFNSYFDPISKLTLNIGKNQILSSVVFSIQLFTGGTAGLIIVIASIASVVIYNFKEFHQDIMIHDQKRGEKIQVVTRTFLMMVILFLVSCVPIAYTIISKRRFPEKRTTDVPYGPLFHFITWWLCVAGSSWNWIIYSFRGTYFQEEARKLWRKCYQDINTPTVGHINSKNCTTKL